MAKGLLHDGHVRFNNKRCDKHCAGNARTLQHYTLSLCVQPGPCGGLRMKLSVKVMFSSPSEMLYVLENPIVIPKGTHNIVLFFYEN